MNGSLPVTRDLRRRSVTAVGAVTTGLIVALSLTPLYPRYSRAWRAATAAVLLEFRFAPVVGILIVGSLAAGATALIWRSIEAEDRFVLRVAAMAGVPCLIAAILYQVQLPEGVCGSMFSCSRPDENVWWPHIALGLQLLLAAVISVVSFVRELRLRSPSVRVWVAAGCAIGLAAAAGIIMLGRGLERI